METESGMGAAGGWAGGEGRRVAIELGVSCGEDAEDSGGERWWWGHNTVSVRNASEPCA